ncbi:S8 family peptidase [Tundrisphaera lichenicola]|uniref:S8 family peptidase n=1 Tax=Tundrisphaera lichenicola TaxID=2029860 RepID=UPI003EC11672
MGWTLTSGRVARDRRRPDSECLETRKLLSTMTVEAATPAASVGSQTNLDGSTNFDQIIGASATRATFGVDGTGQNVAVIDTGVNYQNVALGGSIGPGNKVVAGVDFTGSPNGVLPTWQHGTGVAGILASDTSTYQGVAPGAGVVALRVFGDDNQGSFGNIERALDWVIANHTAYKITAVNVSISDGGSYKSNIFANDGGIGQAITGSIKNLESLDIPVVIAAGNSFNGKAQGQGFPAIIPDAISVTATDASDKLAADAQRLGSGSVATTIAAPGVNITAPSDGNRMVSEDGTSFAAPQVTGGIVLLQQIYENAYHKLPTVSELESLLKEGATTIKDDLTGIKIGRLNILNSANLLRQQIQKDLGTKPVVVAQTLAPEVPASVPVVVPTPVQNPPLQSSPVQIPSAPDPLAEAPAAQAPPAQAPPAVSLTEVFYNGKSIGSYATDQLSGRYPNLFAFLKGPVGSIRIYGPTGSVPNLGASIPSGDVHGKMHQPQAHPRSGVLAKARLTTPPSPNQSVLRAKVSKKWSRFTPPSFHS